MQSEEVVASFEAVKRKLVEAGQPEQTTEYLMQDFKQNVLPETAPQIVINFGLVALCTELEIFISHLVATILRQQPALLKSLASQKSVSTNDILDLGTYEQIVSKLRDKVIKEIVDSNPREMLLTHLGERLGLFAENEFYFDITKSVWGKIIAASVKAEGGSLEWGIPEIEKAFQQRHAVVHEGKLPLSHVKEFGRIHLVFNWCMTFLAAKAVRKFSLTVDDRMTLAMHSTVLTIPQPVPLVEP
jgi:hypothetical protein